MSARCPEGHLSEALDYCDVCGSPMGAAPDGGTASDGGMTSAEGRELGGEQVPPLSVGPDDPALQADGAAPAGGTAAQTCPHCGALNVADALFCESCGYDFTTGTPPMGSEEDTVQADVTEGDEDEAAAQGTDAPSAPVTSHEPVHQATKVGHSATSEADTREPDTDEPSAPVSSPEPVQPATKLVHSPASGDDEGEEEGSDGGDGADGHSPNSENGDGGEDDGGEDDGGEDDGGAVKPTQTAHVAAHRKARHTPPSRALADTWVVELWVDPDWYAVQQTEEACPSAGVPDIVLLTRSTALVGRPSGSLGVRPEVDAGADSAVSRRHAQLTSDGQRWWVEDLGSSNGTFVGTVGEPLPTTPIPPGQRVEIDRDDRLYVGAWTRIVLRQATESERRGTG